MLKSLKIENFRCFQTFELQQLGCLNLLVGTNNSGKTSILEAIGLLTSQSNLQSLASVMINRGEYVVNEQAQSSRELDVRHLFYGHEIDIGSKFSISGRNQNGEEGITITVEQTEQLNLFEESPSLLLSIQCLGLENNHLQLPLSSQEGLSLNYLKPVRRDAKNSAVKTQFVVSSSLTSEKMIELFDQVVLTPDEPVVIQALQIIEPSIERIATVGSEKFRFGGSRNGFVIRLANSDQRIPIGSMGDGTWRILGLTLAMVNARNGVLLVDEIDTGLHFSTMSDMWKLIYQMAKRLNVQVFATTHNSDCWTSLADIASTENSSEEGITIQRIEKGKSNSVVFTERQVVIAATQGIEVR